jgi:hypothetical protein
MDIMGQVGAYNQGIDTQALESDVNRWNYNQERPWDALGRYSGIVSGNNQWGSSSTQDGGGGSSSPFAGALGGGLLGASAASMPYFSAANAATGAAAGGGAALGTALGGWALPLIGAGAGLLFG